MLTSEITLVKMNKPLMFNGLQKSFAYHILVQCTFLYPLHLGYSLMYDMLLYYLNLQ